MTSERAGGQAGRQGGRKTDKQIKTDLELETHAYDLATRYMICATKTSPVSFTKWGTRRKKRNLNEFNQYT